MDRAYIEARIPLPKALISARRWAGEAATLIAPSTAIINAAPWLESAGVPMGTMSNRRSRFTSPPRGRVIGWCLDLEEVLEVESRGAVTGIVAVQAHAGHAPWVTAHGVENLGGAMITPVPEATSSIKAMMKTISMPPALSHGVSDGRERSAVVQAFVFMRAHGHELFPQQLTVEAIRRGWPRTSPLELAGLATDLNSGKQLRYANRLNASAMKGWLLA